jgi:hypothetical protein
VSGNQTRLAEFFEMKDSGGGGGCGGERELADSQDLVE